jgi:ABC-2 type transport system permease protein
MATVGVDQRADPEPALSAEDVATAAGAGERPAHPSALSASLTFGWRALLKIKHVPEQLFDVTAFPVIMTLLFSYLFGGAIAGSVTDYLQFLIPGMLVMTVLLTTMYTGVAINIDIGKGVFDRFRSLRIWRPSPMVGYLLGDIVRYVLGSVVILLLGLLLGFRPDGGVVGVILGVAVVVAFAFAMSWIWTTLGMLLRSDKAVMSMSLLVLFPLTFLSNILVEPATMPGWLKAIVTVNPVTQLVSSVRSLMAGTPNAGALVYVLISGVVLVAVFGALTMRLYNRR